MQPRFDTIPACDRQIIAALGKRRAVKMKAGCLTLIVLCELSVELWYDCGQCVFHESTVRLRLVAFTRHLLLTDCVQAARHERIYTQTYEITITIILLINASDVRK